MALKATTRNELKAHLASLGVENGIDLVIHSKLTSFGLIEGRSSTIYAAIKEMIGPRGTLCVPTFTLNLTADDIYDPDTTPSFRTGAFSEYVRTIPESIRGLCPMHSYTAIGPKAERLAKADPHYSMGPNSSFDIQRKENFYLLLLGCSFQEGASYVHQAEVESGVPYRQWVKIDRKRRASSGIVENITVNYYARDPDNSCNLDLSTLQQTAISMGYARCAPTSYGMSFLISLQKLHDCSIFLIDENPYALLK